MRHIRSLLEPLRVRARGAGDDDCVSSAASAWMCRGHNLCRHSHDAIERLPLVCWGKDGRRLVDEEVDRPDGDNHVLTVD